jgi:HD-like signal output (HDOD) protein
MSKYTAERIALEIINSGKKLPQLPSVSQKLLFLSRQPIEKIDVASFSRLIEGDPALTAKMLQLANSAFYGPLKKIVGVRQAVIHVGLEEAISSVYRYFYKEALPRFPVFERFSGKDFWDHSWACATANRMLGHPFHGHMGQVLPGELYIVGLLHGIGKLFLAISRPDDFQRCLNTAKNLNLPLDQAEEKTFGTTDTEIAYHILTEWNFPPHICSAIRYYHSPGGAQKDNRGLAALTQLAYYIANNAGIGSNGDQFDYDLSQTYISQNWVLPLTDKKQQERVIAEIYSTLQKKSEVLNPVVEDEQPKEAATAPEIKNRTSKYQSFSKKKGLFRCILALLRLA